MEDQIQAVQRMQNYIESHLSEEISFAQLAKVAMYSPWYAHRLFTLWLNITPSDYIRRMRLSRSAMKLRDQQVRVIEVAFEAGFNSVDGFQRAFYKEFGCNPREYAKNPVPICLFTPYGIVSSHTKKEKVMNEVKNIFIQAIDKPVRKVLIKRGQKAEDYYAYCEEVGCDVWGLLLSIKSVSGEPAGFWLPEKYIKPNTSKYVQGVEVSPNYDGVIPDDFDVIELPAAKYLMFQGEPFREEDFEEAISQLWEAIKKYDPAVLGYTWDDENPRMQLEPRGERGYIEFVAVK